MRVAIIGAGLIGQAWAIAFAQAKHDVRLWSRQVATSRLAQKRISKLVDGLAEANLLLGDAAAVISRIRIAKSIDAALASAQYVQESATEDVDVKRELFTILDSKTARSVILASSTSAILPSTFAEALAGRERVLVVHPLNPPYLIPAVEVVPSPWTSREVVDQTRRLMTSIGQVPIVMKKEVTGFLMNRLQGALLDEAFRLVADGYASVEDVDIGLRDGLGLRWSFMGPFETIDLNAPFGVRDYVARYAALYEDLAKARVNRVDWTGSVLEIIESERRKVLAAENLEQRRQWRDLRLAALVRCKRRLNTASPENKAEGE